VETAFKARQLTRPRVVSRFGSMAALSENESEDYLSFRKFCISVGLVIAFIVLFFVVMGLVGYRNQAAAPVKRVYAGPPPLMVGSTGQWQGQEFRVISHAVVEIGEVGAIREHNEYEISDGVGLPAVLVCGISPGNTNWVWLAPLTPADAPTAQQCAKSVVGDLVNVDGELGHVKELFHYTVQRMENVAPSNWQNGEVQYGYLAMANEIPLLVRWNGDGVYFYRGQTFTPAQVKAFVSIFGN
jgi:hypothetical protein